MKSRKKYLKRLYVERKRLGYTQNQMARLIGISRSYYAEIESGKVLPSSKLLFKINDVVKIIFFNNDVGNTSSCEGEIFNGSKRNTGDSTSKS